jgi:hypothetical protein
MSAELSSDASVLPLESSDGRSGLRLTGDQRISKPEAAGQIGLERGRLRLGQPATDLYRRFDRTQRTGPIAAVAQPARESVEADGQIELESGRLRLGQPATDRCVGNLESDPAQVTRHGEAIFAAVDDLEKHCRLPRGDVNAAPTFAASRRPNIGPLS